MKRSVISQYDQLKGRMEGYAAMLYYRYANLCIKADELSLLPIVIVVEGETKKFEDVANVAKDGEYAFKIFPKYDDDLEAVSMGITHEHPEFKQERKTLEVQTEDGKNVEIPYLLVTMPPVDNDRHDVLKQGADALYQECKAQMEAAKTQAEAEPQLMERQGTQSRKGRIATPQASLQADAREERCRLLRRSDARAARLCRRQTLPPNQ